MTSVMDELFTLYDLDQELIKLKQTMEAGPLELAQLDKNVQRTREGRQETEDLVRNTMAKIDQCNLDLQSDAEEIEEQETLLKDIKNSKEYRIVTERLKTLKQRIEEREEQVLGLMETLEEVRAELQTRQEELAVAEAEYDKRKAEIDTASKTIRTKGKELKRQRMAQFSHIGDLNSGAAEEYKSALLRSKGTALAEMKEGTCQACFRKLSPQVVDMVMVGKDFHKSRCQGCGRILYYKKPQA